MKKRPKAHVVDESGQKLMARLLPDPWIIRPLPKDYGVDFEIEICDPLDDEVNLVTGQRFWVQLKTCTRTTRVPVAFPVGAEMAQLLSASGEAVNTSYVPFPYEMDDIEYAGSCPFPLLLFVADLEGENVYWVPIVLEAKERFYGIEPSEIPETPTLQIPCWQNLRDTAESDFSGLRWFALDMMRSYALSRVHQLWHGWQGRYRLDRYRIGDGHIEGEDEELRSSLIVASDLITFCLSQDVLFGDRGIEWFIGNSATRQFGNSFKEWLESGLAAVSEVQSALSSGDYDFRSLSIILARVSMAVNAIPNMIYSYEGLGERFVFKESTAISQAIAEVLDDHAILSVPIQPATSPIPKDA